MRSWTLRMLCEGKTERNFVTLVLAPHLRQFRIYPRAEGIGGTVSFERLRNGIKADLGRSREHEFVTTMIDMYALPALRQLVSQTGNACDLALQLEEEMASEMKHARFIPYVQLHEFEALVLAGLDYLEDQFPDGEARGAAERIRSTYPGLAPEEVDTGEQTAPSKRIIREVPMYATLKATAGPAITAAVGLRELRRQCPHFNRWLHRLEAIAD